MRKSTRDSCLPTFFEELEDGKDLEITGCQGAAVYLGEGKDVAWLACVGRVKMEKCVEEGDDGVR